MNTAIAALALAVSCFSLFISWSVARRAKNAERVTGWNEIGSTPNRESFVATLTVKNPARHDIKLQKLTIDLPDYRLADLEAAKSDDGLGNRLLPADIKPKVFCCDVISAKTRRSDRIQFLIFQPTHSTRKSTRVSAWFWTLEPKPKWKCLSVLIEAT
jgi:hypothetical protein